MSNPSHPSISQAHQGALWIDQLGPITRRPALTGDTEVDVAIVGGGFSGLWTAYYLAKADPSLRILILEKHYCGYGASGRNGGWAVGELAGSFEGYTKVSSPDAARRQARAVFDSVDEIGRVVAAESIDCDYHKGGTIRLARTAPQAKRQREEIEHERSLGFTEDEIRLLEPEEARSHLNATKVSGGIFFSATAALHPARLARGLADVVSGLGVTIAESTTVEAISPGAGSSSSGSSSAGAATTGPEVRTDLGTVRADVVIQATEAYTRDLEGERRALLPIYSLMVATEPLPQSVFDEIGLADRPTFADDRFMVIYGQRTADNRLAFGGRGVPYRFGSKIDRATELHEPSHNLLRDTLTEMLPAIGDVQISHRWGGVLGIPRDWVPSLRLDRASGIGVLGGYVGEGVAAANLAGRTMADLVCGNDTERASFPWVGLKSRSWEPEPFRWLGVRGSRAVLGAADDREEKTDTEANAAYKISRFLRGA